MKAQEVASSASCHKLTQFCIEEKEKEVQQIKNFLNKLQTSAQPTDDEEVNDPKCTKTDTYQDSQPESNNTNKTEKPQDINVQAMTVVQLKSELSKRGIQFAPKALKVQHNEAVAYLLRLTFKNCLPKAWKRNLNPNQKVLIKLNRVMRMKTKMHYLHSARKISRK